MHEIFVNLWLFQCLCDVSISKYVNTCFLGQIYNTTIPFLWSFSIHRVFIGLAKVEDPWYTSHYYYSGSFEQYLGNRSHVLYNIAYRAAETMFSVILYTLEWRFMWESQCLHINIIAPNYYFTNATFWPLGSSSVKIMNTWWGPKRLNHCICKIDSERIISVFGHLFPTFISSFLAPVPNFSCICIYLYVIIILTTFV